MLNKWIRWIHLKLPGWNRSLLNTHYSSLCSFFSPCYIILWQLKQCTSVISVFLSFFVFVFELCNNQATVTIDATNEKKTKNQARCSRVSSKDIFWSLSTAVLKIMHPRVLLSAGGNLRINDSNTSASHVTTQRRWHQIRTGDQIVPTFCHLSTTTC